MQNTFRASFSSSFFWFSLLTSLRKFWFLWRLGASGLMKKYDRTECEIVKNYKHETWKSPLVNKFSLTNSFYELNGGIFCVFSSKPKNICNEKILHGKHFREDILTFKGASWMTCAEEFLTIQCLCLNKLNKQKLAEINTFASLHLRRWHLHSDHCFYCHSHSLS